MNCVFCHTAVDPLYSFKTSNNKEFSVCKECYEDILQGSIRCSCCGNPFHIIRNRCNTFSIESSNFTDDNLILCSRCATNTPVGRQFFRYVSNNLRDYCYKPTPSFRKISNENDNVFMGCELEIGGLRNYESVRNFCNTHGSDFFYYKNDGSIGGCGCEIVSHPATLKYHESDESGWECLFNDFNESHFVSGIETNTGLHVHVSKQALNSQQIKKLDLLINYYQDWFSRLARRNGNHYCSYHVKNHHNWGVDTGDRYQSLNLCNRHTIEFRIFNGTNKLNELFASLELVRSIIELTKNISYDELYEDETSIKQKLHNIAVENNYSNFKNLVLDTTGDGTWR